VTDSVYTAHKVYNVAATIYIVTTAVLVCVSLHIRACIGAATYAQLAVLVARAACIDALQLSLLSGSAVLYFFVHTLRV
jgi:hypothetical protein